MWGTVVHVGIRVVGGGQRGNIVERGRGWGNIVGKGKHHRKGETSSKGWGNIVRFGIRIGVGGGHATGKGRGWGNVVERVLWRGGGWGNIVGKGKHCRKGGETSCVLEYELVWVVAMRPERGEGGKTLWKGCCGERGWGNIVGKGKHHRKGGETSCVLEYELVWVVAM